MKKNKNSKILLPIVIIIWGVLIYKVYDAFNPGENKIRESNSENFIPPQSKERDTFSLLPIDSDPFLGIAYIKKQVNTTKPAPNNRKKEEEVIWPVINYLGIVSDENSITSVFILQINGQQYLIKKSETIQEIILINGSQEKVILRYKGKEKEYLIM